jgi:hypothetical protein
MPERAPIQVVQRGLQWQVLVSGHPLRLIDVFSSLERALEHAREIALSMGELVIVLQRRDGSEERRHAA